MSTCGHIDRVAVPHSDGMVEVLAPVNSVGYTGGQSLQDWRDWAGLGCAAPRAPNGAAASKMASML
jgi:hypothetical protein